MNVTIESLFTIHDTTTKKSSKGISDFWSKCPYAIVFVFFLTLNDISKSY